MVGRTLKLTPEMVKQLCLYIENGNANKDACAMIGISESSFYSWLAIGRTVEDRTVRKTKSNEVFLELLESLKIAESKFRAFHLGNINEASKREWQASAWMLERRFPKEYGRRTVELELPAGNGGGDGGGVILYLPANGRDKVEKPGETNGN